MNVILLFKHYVHYLNVYNNFLAICWNIFFLDAKDGIIYKSTYY